MPWYPTYNLFDSSGTLLLYPFQYITSDNSPATPIKFNEISGIRGNGSIIIGGSNSAWDIELDFVLLGTNYEDTIAQIDDLEFTIALNTEYVLKIDRTISTTKDYNVKRLVPIRWEKGKRYSIQRGTIIFRVLSW